MYGGRVAYPERELCILRTWGPHMCDMSCSLGLASSQNAPGKAMDAMSPTRLVERRKLPDGRGALWAVRVRHAAKRASQAGRGASLESKRRCQRGDDGAGSFEDFNLLRMR
jgi:hypothetical protein